MVNISFLIQPALQTGHSTARYDLALQIINWAGLSFQGYVSYKKQFSTNVRISQDRISINELLFNYRVEAYLFTRSVWFPACDLSAFAAGRRLGDLPRSEQHQQMLDFFASQQGAQQQVGHCPQYAPND
jgi:hypothetical protein